MGEFSPTTRSGDCEEIVNTPTAYPHELTMSGTGEDDKVSLYELVERLQPFLEKIK
jgi:hypothetical protein